MRNPANRWVVCGLLFLATVLNYLDRQTISVSATKIAEEMGLNDWQLGRLFSGFLFSYGICQILLGPLLDRIRTIWAYALAVALWSLAGAASGLATGFWFLLATRMLLGVCEAPNWPLALRVVARTFPPAQRSLASGIFQSGTSIGALIAPPIIIYLATTYNWRISFFAMGASGILWVALWLIWFRVSPEPVLDAHVEASGGARTMDGTPSSIVAIVRSRSFWGMVVATSFLNPLQYFYTTWLPRYYDSYAGVDFGRDLAQRLVAGYLALDLGLWTGGALVAMLAKRRTVRHARMVVTSIGAACMATCPLVSQLRTINHITAVLCIALFGLGWFMSNYLSFSSEVSTARVSTAVGLLGGIGSLAGAGFMLLVGWVVQWSGGFTAVFLMVGAMPLISLAGMWCGTRDAPIKS